MAKIPSRSDTDVVVARAGAQLVDMFLVGGLYSSLSMFVGFVPAEGYNPAVSTLLTLMPVVVGFGHIPALEAICDGQTMGKWLAGIRAVGDDGEHITARSAVVRNLPVFVPVGLTYIIAFASMASTDRRQRVFDRIAGTVVVPSNFHSDPTDTPAATWENTGTGTDGTTQAETAGSGNTDSN